jgi:hypothetical protein
MIQVVSSVTGVPHEPFCIDIRRELWGVAVCNATARSRKFT